MSNLPEQRPAGLTAVLAKKFDMEPRQFLDTIKSTVMPSNATNEEVCTFLMVAREYGFNPLLREIHAFPKKGGGICTVVGVDGWAKLICGNKNFDGTEFEYEFDKNGLPVSTTCTLYRKDCQRPVKVTEYFAECSRNTDPWKTMPRRMLRHKALMQCGRYAFGLSGIVDEDEAEDMKEVEARVVDDPLKPGRHETKPKAKPEPTPEPEIEQEVEEKTLDDATNEAKEPPAKKPKRRREMPATKAQIDRIGAILMKADVAADVDDKLVAAFGGIPAQGFESLTFKQAEDLIINHLEKDGWLEKFASKP